MSPSLEFLPVVRCPFIRFISLCGSVVVNVAEHPHRKWLLTNRAIVKIFCWNLGRRQLSKCRLCQPNQNPSHTYQKGPKLTWHSLNLSTLCGRAKVSYLNNHHSFVFLFYFVVFYFVVFCFFVFCFVEFCFYRVYFFNRTEQKIRQRINITTYFLFPKYFNSQQTSF